MKTLAILFIFALFTGFANLVFAQGNTVDVLYLKNGSIIRGSIIELVPDQTVRIRTSDGSVFVFKMDEVERIEKSESATPSLGINNSETNPWKVHRQIASVGLGSAIAATLVGSLAMDDEYFATTVLPVVGPWVTMARIESDPNSEYMPGGKPLLIASGAIQGGLLVYFVVSLVNEKAYNRKASLSLVPRSGGFSLFYRF